MGDQQRTIAPTKETLKQPQHLNTAEQQKALPKTNNEKQKEIIPKQINTTVNKQPENNKQTIQPTNKISSVVGGVVHNNKTTGGASTTENNKNKNEEDAHNKSSKKGRYSLAGDVHHPSQPPSPSPILATNVASIWDQKERTRSR